MIHLVVINGEYYSWHYEDNKHVETTKYLSEALIFDEEEEANVIANKCGGTVVSYFE